MIKNFNNFLQESKIPIKILQSLTDLVQKRFKNIGKNSYIFAKIINKYFQFNEFLFISKLEFSDNVKDVRHIYVYLGGKYLDGEGFHTKSEIIKKFELSDETFKDCTFLAGIEKLKDCSEILPTTLSEKEQKEIEHLIRQFNQLL